MGAETKSNWKFIKAINDVDRRRLNVRNSIANIQSWRPESYQKFTQRKDEQKPEQIILRGNATKYYSQVSQGRHESQEAVGTQRKEGQKQEGECLVCLVRCAIRGWVSGRVQYQHTDETKQGKIHQDLQRGPSIR